MSFDDLKTIKEDLINILEINEDENMDNSQLNDENKETTNNIIYRRKKNN